jgi:iron(III) transport system permease protein
MWNTPTLEALLTTTLIGVGASSVSVAIGVMLAVSCCYYRVYGWRLLEASLLSLILVPLYVQAVAWSSGFGVQGWIGSWLGFSQVAAAISKSYGVIAVIWIHGCALVPLVYMIQRMGLRRLMDYRTRQALVDFGPHRALFQQILPRLLPWLGVSFFLAFALTTNDMVVSNLFQVPSLTESLYQQVQFDELRFSMLATSCSLACCLGIAIAIGLEFLSNRLGDDSSSMAFNLVSTSSMVANRWRWLVGCCAWLLFALVQAIPLCNLVVRAGWQSTMQAEMPLRRWSFRRFCESLWDTHGFSGEIAMSLQLCVSCMLLSLLISGLLVFLSKERWVRMGLVVAMGTAIALPGPAINLIVQQWNTLVSTWMPDFGRWLTDNTLIGPILALQFRCVPIVYAVLLLAAIRFGKKRGLALAMDRSLSVRKRIWIFGRALFGPVVAGGKLSLIVAFGDLSTYLLVLPPGATPVAMRMFELLHYGVKNQDAALALILGGAAMSIVTTIRSRQ